jgi:ketosteroid isomerase-like protein
MSQENVEVVKRAIDAFNRRDLAVYDDLYTPEYEWFPALIGAVDGESFQGREGLARYYEVVIDTWEEFHVVGENFRDLGDSVLVRIRVDGRGRRSGAPVVGRQSLICDFRDEKVARVRSFLNHCEALRAAGLSE